MNKTERKQSFYFLSGVAGLVLLVLEIGIYQHTIIPFKIPFLVTLVFTVVTFFLIQKDYRQTYQVRSLFFPFAQSFVSIGFISCYLFMAINYFFPDKSTTRNKSVTIINKHILSGRGNTPAMEVDYDGTEKQLVFSNKERSDWSKATEVELIVKDGFFGFAIIERITLK